MGQALVIEHDDKVYEIGIDDLAKYEVADDAVKQELAEARDSEPVDDEEDEVEGFARRPRAMRLRRASASIFLIRR